MDIPDRLFAMNRDWDPQYLRELVTQDFYEFKHLWLNSLLDMELLAATKGGSNARYCPVMEDISLDGQTLYDNVEQIEYE